MAARDRRSELRGAVYGGDDAALLQMLREEPWPEHCLQLVGDGLAGALARGAAGAGALAQACVSALRERDWRGDEELAEALEARLGVAPARLLRPLPVDLDELSGVLEGDPVQGRGRIDLRTGEVWQESTVEYFREIGQEEEDADDPDRWLWFSSEGSRDGYRDMELFIADLSDADAADRLGIAITGRGAFRRFKDVLSRWPDLQDRWYAFSDDRCRGRARAWLADEGYAATPPSRSS